MNKDGKLLSDLLMEQWQDFLKELVPPGLSNLFFFDGEKIKDMEIEIDDISKEPGTVVQEIQKGYVMKDRLLRPSMVGVTRFRTENNKKDQENKENDDNKK